MMHLLPVKLGRLSFKITVCGHVVVGMGLHSYHSELTAGGLQPPRSRRLLRPNVRLVAGGLRVA